MALHVDAALDDFDALGFKEFTLQAGVRFANEKFAALADDAMPGNAFARGSGGHGVTSGSGAAGQA